MSIVQFFRILWARRWIVLAATLGCFGAALLATQILPTRYEAKSRIMLELLKPDPVTGQVLANNFARTYTSTQIELIRDYRVTGAVADKLGWTSSPELLAQYNASNPAGGVDFRRWLSTLVADNTRVEPVLGSNILEITYTGNSPDAARAVADAIRDAYVEQTLATKREGASGSADWFDGQVNRVREQLTAAERRLTGFQRTYGIVLNDDATDLEANRLRALAGAAEATAVAPVVTAGASTSPAALQLSALDSAITGELDALGPNHPRVVELRRQRGVLAAAVAKERAPVVTGGASGPSIGAQVAKQTARVIGQRDKVEEARRLQADVNVLRDQYVKAQQRSAELRLQADSNDSGLTLLGSAVAPRSPSFPNMPLIAFGSLGLGLALGVLAALITEMLSRRVRGVEDLTFAGVPVIGVIHGWQPKPARGSLLSRLSPSRRRREPVPA